MVKKTFQSLKQIIFQNPDALFLRERHLTNQPFFFSGTNGKAVLLIHGWTSTAYEVRRLGTYLNDRGYSVSGPLLRGHGTVPKDLEFVKWSDWICDLEKEYQRLRGEHQKVFIMGTSIGANLTIKLARKYPETEGIVLMATPYKIRLEPLTLLFAKTLRLFRRYSKKIYPPTFGSIQTVTRRISYQTYPIDSALETFKLIQSSREDIPGVLQPCFLIQSSSDHIVSSNSLEKLYANIGSQNKKMRYLKRAYHTFISDIKNEHVFEEIFQFIEEN